MSRRDIAAQVRASTLEGAERSTKYARQLLSGDEDDEKSSDEMAMPPERFVGKAPPGGDSEVAPDEEDEVPVVDSGQSDPIHAPSREELFEAGRFVPPKLGRLAEEVGKLRIGPDGSLWRYHKGVYLPDAEEWLAGFVREHLSDEFRRNRLSEVSAWCRANVGQKLPVQPAEEPINVANGLLYWREDPPRLEPHWPGAASIMQLPVEWHPEARCPRIFEFFQQVLPAEEFNKHYQLLVEWIGYCLIPTAKMKRALLLLGPRDTGKSRLLGLIGALLGEANVAHATLQALADNRFAAADLYGKFANLSADLDAKAVQATGVFKMLVSGDPMRVERKYRDGFNYRPYARLVFSANEAPGTADQSDAYYKRWDILPMRRQVRDEVQDPDLLAKLTPELPGLLVHAVAGLRTLMTRGRFEPTKTMRAAAEEYRAKTDTIVGFSQDRLEFRHDASERSSAVYADYDEWCKDNTRRPLGKQRFKEDLTEVYSRIEYKHRHNGTPTFFGIALRDESADGVAG